MNLMIFLLFKVLKEKLTGKLINACNINQKKIIKFISYQLIKQFQIIKC